MRYSEIIEGLTVSPEKQLKFNYGDPTGVSTRLGKSSKPYSFVPYVKQDKTLGGYTIYSVYAADDATEILKTLKKKTDIGMEEADYQQFLNRSALFITAKILRPNNIDIIVTPKSSSNILNDLLSLIANKNPHIRFLPDTYVKIADISKIQIDYNNPRITDTIAKRLEDIIHSAIKTGSFEMKKVLPRNRNFLRNFLEIIDPSMLKLFNGQNVCVMDDVITTGITQMEIIRSIADYNPNNVIGVTLYKTDK